MVVVVVVVVVAAAAAAAVVAVFRSSLATKAWLGAHLFVWRLENPCSCFKPTPSVFVSQLVLTRLFA